VYHFYNPQQHPTWASVVRGHAASVIVIRVDEALQGWGVVETAYLFRRAALDKGFRAFKRRQPRGFKCLEVYRFGEYLDYYLDEFTFRFNRRRSSARGLLFHHLAQQALAVGPAPYHSIIPGAAPVLGCRGYPFSGIPPMIGSMDLLIEGRFNLSFPL